MTPDALDAYCERVGWSERARPDLATLSGLLRAHMTRIPFENLDVLRGRRPRLDLDSLQAKLVGARRGGYCFEQATLFAAVLEALGFRPVRHAARVVLHAARTEVARTHMFLTVPLAEGTYVVDPGFGALAPPRPVPLLDGGADGPAQATHWMVRDGPHWALRTRSDAGVADAWVSTLEVENPIDFEMANHYTSTHPASPFVNRLMLRAYAADGAMVTVMNRDVTRRRGGRAETATLADRAALRALLATDFGFDFPEAQHLAVPSIPEWR
jgi:N-hydroxyarylamine O-acetyltransferase